MGNFSSRFSSIRRSTRQEGFSLMELLVVIGIIGILITMLTVNFTASKEKAANKAIQTGLKEMQLALEVYKAQYGQYPNAYDAGVADCSSTAFGVTRSFSTDCGSDPYIDGLAPQFIEALVSHEDSANSNCVIKYHVATDNSWYKLTAEQCGAGISSNTDADAVKPDSEFARCLSSCGVCNDAVASFYTSYAVYSFGGACQL